MHAYATPRAKVRILFEQICDSSKAFVKCTICSRKGQQSKTYGMALHVVGTLLIRALLDRFRITKLLNPPQDSGKDPDSLLILRSTTLRVCFIRLLHSIGRLPLRLFLVTLTEYMVFKAAQEAGNVPVNWLLVTNTSARWVMLLQDSGSVPLMLHSTKVRDMSCIMSFQASGRGPLRVSA